MNREKLIALIKELTEHGQKPYESIESQHLVKLIGILLEDPKAALKELEAPTRNLIYHITPMGNWRWNLAHILKDRIWELFTGKKAFAVAQGPGLEPLLNVVEFMEGMIDLESPDVTIEKIGNHPVLRETHSFPMLLLRASEWTGYTFYGHTKGVTRGDDPAVKLWTEALYHFNLDNFPAELLEQYPVVGAIKRHGTFPNFPRSSRWHYSGTFFWFRNEDLFSKLNWTEVPQTRYGAEAYLSMLFPLDQAGCIAGDKFGDPYKLNIMKDFLRRYDYFKEALAELDNSNRDAARSVQPMRAVGKVSKIPSR